LTVKCCKSPLSRQRFDTRNWEKIWFPITKSFKGHTKHKKLGNVDNGFSPFGYKPNILAFSTRLLIGNGGNQFHSGANEHRQNAKNWAKLEMGKTEKFAGNVY